MYILSLSLSLSLWLGPPFSPSQSSSFMGFVASGSLRLAFCVLSVGGGSLLGWVHWSMVVVMSRC